MTQEMRNINQLRKELQVVKNKLVAFSPYFMRSDLDVSIHYPIPEKVSEFIENSKVQQLAYDYLKLKFKNNIKLLDSLNKRDFIKPCLISEDISEWQSEIYRLESEISLYADDENKSYDLEEDGLGYLIDGLIPNDSYGEIYGASGNYKTTLILEMVFCIAHGLSYYGKVVKQGKIIYIAGEGVGGLGKRIKALELKYNTTLNTKNFIIFSGWDIGNEDNIASKEHILSSLEYAQMLVVDTLNRNCSSIDENSASGWAKVMMHLEKYIKPYVNSIVWIHHTTKAGNESRGTGARYGSADFVYFIKAIATNKATMTCTKMKDDVKPESIQFSIMQLGNSIVPKLINKTDKPISDDAKEVYAKIMHLDELTQELFRDAVHNVIDPNDEMNASTKRTHISRIKKSLLDAGLIKF